MAEQQELKQRISELSFEQAIERLEEVVELLESGQIPLEEAINLYQEGILLSRHCDLKLTQVEQKIQMLIEEDGKIMTKDFGFEED
jgi:exodeoxyribonuclease VII small subunit